MLTIPRWSPTREGNMKTKGEFCWPALVTALVLSSGRMMAHPQPQASRTAAAIITQVEVSRTGQETVVRVSGNGRLVLQTQRLNSPERLVLHYAEARLALARASVPSTLRPVRRVRLGQFKPDVARVVVDLEYVVPYSLKTEGQSVTIVFATVNTAPTGSPAISPVPPEQRKAAAYGRSTQTAPWVPAPRAAPNPSGAPPSESSIQQTSVAANPAAPQQQAETSQNSVENGMLTLCAKNQPLRVILEEIGSKANVAIIVPEALGNEPVSVEFQHYRLDEALRQMLKDDDVVFSYSVDRDHKGPASLKTVWVYPANQGPGMSRSSLSAWKAGTKQLARTLAEADPEARARAVDSLIKREGRQSVSVVLDALRDPSGDVREQALSRALSMGVALPENTLTDLALNDESSKVRLLALQALPVDPAFRWVAERALNDWSSKVARLAKDILRQLDAAARPAS
jgi:hypothetical protein